MNTFAGHNQDVNSIFSGNPGQMITSSAREIKVWDTRNDTVIRAFNTIGNITCITYAGNNRVVAGLNNGHVQIFNTTNGTQEYSGAIHNSQINCLHTDGRSLVTGSNDHTAKVMDLNTKEITFNLQGHEKPVNSIQMDDNKIVSGGGDMCLKVWNRKTGALCYSLLGGSLQQRGNNNPHPQKEGCSQLMFDSCRIIGSFSSLLRINNFLKTK